MKFLWKPLRQTNREIITGLNSTIVKANLNNGRNYAVTMRSVELIHPSEFFSNGERSRFQVRPVGEHGVRAKIQGVPVEIIRKPQKDSAGFNGWYGTIGGRSFAIYPYNSPGHHNGYLALPEVLNELSDRRDRDYERKRSMNVLGFSSENSSSGNPVSGFRLANSVFHGYSTDHAGSTLADGAPRSVFRTLFRSALRIGEAETLLGQMDASRRALEETEEHRALKQISDKIRKKFGYVPGVTLFKRNR
ncbi:hypothetical protein HY994_05290 [Candidatus Micrarchaeota archaeon]|nr:hypothetical protein [Candidatus Micrarchaeota archaeon]